MYFSTHAIVVDFSCSAMPVQLIFAPISDRFLRKEITHRHKCVNKSHNFVAQYRFEILAKIHRTTEQQNETKSETHPQQ